MANDKPGTGPKRIQRKRPKGVRKRCENCGDEWQYWPGEKKCVLCGGKLREIAND